MATALISDFPRDVPKWMKQNAAPKMALKLMQVCKYFQHPEFPYLVVRDFAIDGDEAAYIQNGKEEIVETQSIIERVWILHQLIIVTANFSLKKIAVCEVKKLALLNNALSLNEFKFLAKNVTDLVMSEATVKYEGGRDAAALEDLLECLPNVQFMTPYPCNSSIINLEKANSLPLFRGLELRLSVGETFNVALFTSFLLKNQHIYVIISDHNTYSSPLKDEILLRIRLQTFADEIIQHWSIKYRPPTISFPKQTESSQLCLKHLAMQHNYEYAIKKQ